MTAIAWIVRHTADTPETRPVVYFTQAEADAHAAQFRPGFAVVVPLGDVAAARAQALDDAALACEVIANRTAVYGKEYGQAVNAMDKCAAAIRALS